MPMVATGDSLGTWARYKRRIAQSVSFPGCFEPQGRSGKIQLAGHCPNAGTVGRPRMGRIRERLRATVTAWGGRMISHLGQCLEVAMWTPVMKQPLGSGRQTTFTPVLNY